MALSRQFTARQYTMLIASLPQYETLFEAKLTPLSRIKLDQRLSMLEEEDARLLVRIEDLLQWDRIPKKLSDREIVAQANALLAELEGCHLAEILRDRLEQRTALAALRRRHRGEGPPRGPWGCGRWVAQIERRWSEPDFGLRHALPWIGDAARLLAEGDSIGLERLVLGVAWKQLARARGEHFFDFEAVVIYVLRWNIVARWTRYDEEAARRRFAGLVETGLGEYAALFA